MVLIANLTKKFGNKTIIENIDLTINEHTIYAIIGRNGVGKSTLFNMIADFIKPTSGEIIIYGKKHQDEDDNLKKKMGLMLQERGLIDEFTGFEYLKFISLLYEVEDKNIDKKIEDTFSYFFDEKKDLFKKIANYSFGMQQKVAFVASILHKPKLLILDEPFIGLDIFSVNRVIEFLKSFSVNRIVLLASHDLSHIAQVATHLGILEEGKLIYDGTIKNFVNESNNLIEKSLLELLQPKEEDLTKIDWLL